MDIYEKQLRISKATCWICLFIMIANWVMAFDNWVTVSSRIEKPIAEVRQSIEQMQQLLEGMQSPQKQESKDLPDNFSETGCP